MQILLKSRALGGITRKTVEKNIKISKPQKFYAQAGEFCMKNLPAWSNNQEYQLGSVQAWRNFCKNSKC